MLNGSDCDSEEGIADAGIRTVCKNGSSALISKSVLSSTAGGFGSGDGFEPDPGIRIVCIKGSESGSGSGADFFTAAVFNGWETGVVSIKDSDSGSGADFFTAAVFNGWEAGVVSIKDSDSGSGFDSGTRLASGIGISARVGSV